MEKHSRKQCIAIIEHCMMTEVGLRHLLMHAHSRNSTFHFYRTIREFKLALRQTSFDVLICCLPGTREPRIECLFTMEEIAHHDAGIVRIILANDSVEADLIKHLSPTYLHGVLSKSSPLAELQQSLLDLLREAALGHECADASLLHHESRCLSPTENMILRYMTYGYSLMEIAQRLDRNIKTIRAHKFNAMTKLGVNSDVGLLSAADLLVSLPDRNTAYGQRPRCSA